MLTSIFKITSTLTSFPTHCLTHSPYTSTLTSFPTHCLTHSPYTSTLTSFPTHYLTHSPYTSTLTSFPTHCLTHSPYTSSLLYPLPLLLPHHTPSLRHSLTIHLLPPSLVPRPHPLMRRNGLVNQVEFLGLAHTFATL